MHRDVNYGTLAVDPRDSARDHAGSQAMRPTAEPKHGSISEAMETPWQLKLPDIDTNLQMAGLATTRSIKLSVKLPQTIREVLSEPSSFATVASTPTQLRLGLFASR